MEVTLSQTAELLKKAQSIVLTAHIHPDGDALGSMLGLYHYLISEGKQVEMLLDDELPLNYCFLPGMDKIVKPGENEITADLLVILDASDVERVLKVREYVHAPSLNIDHHISNTKFADYLYLDAKAAATAEVLCDLFAYNQALVSTDMANCLYTGIATDCGFFRYANTSPKTLRHAANLLEAGVKPHLISEQLETRSLNSLRTLTTVLDTLELFAEGKIAAITVEASILKENEELAEGMINYPRNIEGVDVAIMFKEVSDELVRVSLRSRGVDVSRLALTFGGGGHIRAAGCSIAGTIAEAKKKVIAAASALLQEG